MNINITNFCVSRPLLIREVSSFAQLTDALPGLLIPPVASHNWNAFTGSYHPFWSHSQIWCTVGEDFLAAGHVKPGDFRKARIQSRPTTIHLGKSFLKQRYAHLPFRHFCEDQLRLVATPRSTWQVVINFNDLPAIAAAIKKLNLVLAIFRNLRGWHRRQGRQLLMFS